MSDRDPNRAPEFATLAADLAELRQLFEAHRFALLGSVAAMLAHELNNIMQPLLTYAEEAARTEDRAFHSRAFERIARQGRRAVAFCHRLLELAAPPTPVVATCSLRERVLAALESLARPLDRDGIEYQLDIPPEITVRAEALLIEQVFLNLILHARDAMAQGGGSIRFTAVPDGDQAVLIDVVYTGRRLNDAALQARLNHFLHTDWRSAPADWEPVGLGLAVCRMIAQTHGATIEAAASEDGRGCRVRMRWPSD